MTEKVTIDGKATLFWLLLCVGILDAQALGLGRLQGTALIGRALDVSVQVQTDPGEDSGALCLDAEVFHADTRQDQRLVRVTLDAVVAGQIANARIVSSTPVDEPVVTVLLRAGCAQKTTRRYVLLADPPADVPTPLVPLVAPLASAPAAAPPSIATVTTSATATPVSNGAAAALNGQPLAPAIQVASANTRAGSLNGAAAAELPAPATKPASTAAEPKPASSTVTTPVAALPERSALLAGPRLTLSPAVPRAERVDKPLTGAPAPALAPASAVVVAPAAVVANDATALAAQKIQTLERDIAAALARSARLEASLTDMNTRLQQAESQRWPSELLYGLVVLVLACLLSVGWLWNRLRRLQAERGGLWRHSVMNQTDPAADLDQPRASSFAVAAAVSSQASPLTESVQSFELQREPFYPGTDPSQDRAAPLTEPTLAAAELSLDLDNLIDFDSSQGKKPPVS
jgi:hypothetical protein